MKTLVSLWIIVTALLLLSLGGSRWIGGESNGLAVLLLIAGFALCVAGIFVYTGEQQRRAEDVTHPTWWIHKILDLVWKVLWPSVLLLLLFRDFRIAVGAGCVSLVIGSVLMFLEWKRLAKARPQ